MKLTPSGVATQRKDFAVNLAACGIMGLIGAAINCGSTDTHHTVISGFSAEQLSVGVNVRLEPSDDGTLTAHANVTFDSVPLDEETAEEVANWLRNFYGEWLKESNTGDAMFIIQLPTPE